MLVGAVVLSVGLTGSIVDLFRGLVCSFLCCFCFAVVEHRQLTMRQQQMDDRRRKMINKEFSNSAPGNNSNNNNTAAAAAAKGQISQILFFHAFHALL